MQYHALLAATFDRALNALISTRNPEFASALDNIFSQGCIGTLLLVDAVWPILFHIFSQRANMQQSVK